MKSKDLYICKKGKNKGTNCAGGVNNGAYCKRGQFRIFQGQEKICFPKEYFDPCPACYSISSYVQTVCTIVHIVHLHVRSSCKHFSIYPSSPVICHYLLKTLHIYIYIHICTNTVINIGFPHILSSFRQKCSCNTNRLFFQSLVSFFKLSCNFSLIFILLYPSCFFKNIADFFFSLYISFALYSFLILFKLLPPSQMPLFSSVFSCRFTCLLVYLSLFFYPSFLLAFPAFLRPKRVSYFLSLLITLPQLICLEFSVVFRLFLSFSLVSVALVLFS